MKLNGLKQRAQSSEHKSHDECSQKGIRDIKYMENLVYFVSFVVDGFVKF
jgi:hypothetical protein